MNVGGWVCVNLKGKGNEGKEEGGREGGKGRELHSVMRMYKYILGPVRSIFI